MFFKQQRIYSQLLKKHFHTLTGLDALKFYYRPYICPFHKILPLIRESSAHVDIGCGNGLFLWLISHFYPEKKLIGLDINQKSVNNCKEKLGNIASFFTYDGISFPEILKEATSISLIDVIHHIPHESQEIFFESLIRYSAPGCRLILKDIDRNIWPLIYMNRLHDILLADNYGYELSRKEMRGLLEKYDFTVEEEFREINLWYAHFCFVARFP